MIFQYMSIDKRKTIKHILDDNYADSGTSTHAYMDFKMTSSKTKIQNYLFHNSNFNTTLILCI